MDKASLQLIRDSFGRVVYTHKSHEKDAEIQRSYAVWVKWINILLLALTSGSALSALITNLLSQSATGLLITTLVISALTLGFSLFQLSFNPEALAASHKQVANELWEIRELYRNLIADMHNGALTNEQAISKRDDLNSRLSKLYKSAPPTTSRAYAKASEGLKKAEEFSFTDEEIDAFLPSELRIGKVEGAEPK